MMPPMPEALPSSWLSLLPALVTIVLAFLTRQVIASLAAGILTGGLVVLILTGSLVALVFAYLVRFFAVSLNAVDTALAKVTPNMDGAARTLGIWQGSCAELVAELVPKGVSVVSAFQNVSAHRLQALDAAVECDVVVSGSRPARQRVMALCGLVPGLRAVDGGPLSNARIVESIAALLIGLNVRYKVPEGLGIRLTGLPE